MGTSLDLLISGGRVVLPFEREPVQCSIGVKGGRIAALIDDGLVPEAERHLRVDGLHVLPGLIDSHVHAREPGYTEREDFETCTRGAAAGGITTIIEQPVCDPPTASLDALVLKWELANRKAYVDFALYGGAGWQSLNNISELADAGVCAFKTFLGEPHVGREAEFEGLYVANDMQMVDVFAAVAETDVLQCVHAENSNIIQALERRLVDRGRISSTAYVEARPVYAEVEAIERCLTFAAHVGARIHILHCSCAEGVDRVSRARRHGLEASVETCPHYLCANDKHVERLGPFARIAPPLRDAEQNEALALRLARGDIDTVGSDHGPHMPEAKEKGWDNIFEAPAGSAGVEQMVPLMLTGVSDGRWTIADVANVLCHRVADLYGLSPKKGGIVLGSDADFTIVNVDEAWSLSDEKCQARARHSARLYDGWPVVGRTEMTIVRGHIVYDRGRFPMGIGFGEFVPRRGAPNPIGR
jgi:allantoinase